MGFLYVIGIFFIIGLVMFVIENKSEDFPKQYNPYCFDCDDITCEGCPYRNYNGSN
jgi:hypothetical protein